MNVQDFTGLSGGPAFLPVNPKQTHYQIEDSLAWVKGQHSMKFGYRLVDRFPSPFTHTDTRSTLTFNRNFTNNPVNNAGGTGLATLLTGYMTAAARGFLLEPYTLRTQEHGLFVQDDMKLGNRLTVNAGLRYEIFTAPTEEENRLVNFDLANLTLIYAGENGASETVNLKTRKNNFAPRLGLTYLITDDSRTILRTGYGITYFPVAASASNLLGQQVPYTISQNVNPEVNPVNWGHRPQHRQSVPANPAGQAADHCGAERGQPARARPRVRERDARRRSSGTSASSASCSARSSPRSATSAVPASTWCSAGTPTRCSPARERQASRRLLQPLSNAATIIQCDPRNRSTYHGLQTRVNQRYTNGMQMLFSYTWGKSLDYGGSAASGGGQTGESADRDRPGCRQGSVRLRRPAPRRAQRRLRTAVGPQSRVAEPGRTARRHRRRLADQHDHDGHDRSAVQRLARHWRQQRRPELAGSHRVGQARQSDRRSLVQPRRFRGAAAQHVRRRRARRALLAGAPQLRPVAHQAHLHVQRPQPTRRSASRRSTCSTIRVSASRMPRSARRPSAASRRRWWTTAACSSRSSSTSERTLSGPRERLPREATARRTPRHAACATSRAGRDCARARRSASRWRGRRP